MAFINKRIITDMKELQRAPLDGASLNFVKEEDMFTLHGSVVIEDGPYEGLFIHFEVILGQDYPHKAPEMYVLPYNDKSSFGRKFHGHIHRCNGRLSVCNDMTYNFQSTFSNQKMSGWNSACTLKSLLLNTKLFFADPDEAHLGRMPDNKEVQDLRLVSNQFKCQDCQGCKGDLMSKMGEIETRLEDITLDAVKNASCSPILGEELMCFLCKEDVVRNPSLVIGYPLKTTRNQSGKICLSSYCDPLCKTCFDATSSSNRVTSRGDYFNEFIPLCLDASIGGDGPKVERQGTLVNSLRSLAQIKTDAGMLEIMIQLLNGMVLDIFKGLSHNSEALLKGYCHFLQNTVFLLRRTPHLMESLKLQVRSFQQGHTSKKDIPDIGIFLMKIFLSRTGFGTVKKTLLQEYFARQVFWARRDHKVNESETRVDKRLAENFAATKVSNGLLMVCYSLFKTFINGPIIAELDSHYGVPTQDKVLQMQNLINYAKDGVTGYKAYIELIDCIDVLSSPQAVFNALRQAVQRAREQGYV